MEEDYNMVRGIDKLAELLIERGIEFFVKDEVSLAFKDDVGNWHECWMAGADENHVNALIVVTPEQLLSVPDLNGIIAENAKMRYKVHVLENDNKWLQILNNSVEANNAKLRELVRDMMGFFEDGDWCEKCERALDCQEQEQYEDECLMRFVFRDRMCELGVEAK